MLFTLLKKSLLLFNDAARDFQQRIVTTFQTFYQPFRFLQITADKLRITVAA
ncbi:hypothetical protein D3C86_2029260 [compost metagenome]